MDKLDFEMYRIVYKNGVLDLKALEFREGLQRTDFVTKTIQFDFEKPKVEHTAFVKEVVKKICNYDENHLDRYLSCLGYAFTGDSTKLCIIFYIVGILASNGKSTIFDVLEDMIPEYVCKAKKECLDVGADLRKQINSMRGKLIVYLNEVTKKPKDTEAMKELADGTGFSYDKLYSVSVAIFNKR